MPEGENLSKDPANIVLDKGHKYTREEMRKILDDRANAVYTPEKTTEKKSTKKGGFLGKKK